MMARILKLGFNELRLTWKDRTSAIWMVLMPILFILFFGSAGGGGSQDPSNVTIRLTVVDNDVSWLSRVLVETLKGEDFEVVEAAPEEAPALAGRVRTLVIPAGFAEAVARKEQVTLFLVRQPDANDSATQLAEVHIFRALARLTGTLVEMQVVAGSDEPIDLQVDRVVEYRGLIQRPPLVSLEQSYAGTGRAVPSGFAQAVPGMLTQFMIMMVMIVGTVYLTTEKVSGVLRRLAVAPFTPRTLILGKLSGLVMLALVQAGILIAAGAVIGATGLFGAEFYWGDSPVGLAMVVTASAIAAGGVTLFFGAILATPTQARAVGWLAGLIMSGLGGCWWPLEIVPPWLRTVAHFVPTAWTMDALHKLTSFGLGIEAVALDTLVLLAFGAVFAYLGGRFLKVQP